MSKKLTHNDNVNKHKYKECAGRNCKNAGISNLKIKYIHKSGWFCNSCKNDLKEADLIDITEKRWMAQ
jgi:hypothetical protein